MNKLAKLKPLPRTIEHTSDECRVLVRELLMENNCQNVLVLGAGRGGYGIDFILCGGKKSVMVDVNEVYSQITKYNISINNVSDNCEMVVSSISDYLKNNKVKYDAVVCGTSWVYGDELLEICENHLKESGILIQTIRNDFIDRRQFDAMNMVARKHVLENIHHTVSESDNYIRLTYCVRKL